MGVSSLPSLHPLDALLFTFGHMHVPAPRLSATEHDAGAAYTPSPSAVLCAQSVVGIRSGIPGPEMQRGWPHRTHVPLCTHAHPRTPNQTLLHSWASRPDVGPGSVAPCPVCRELLSLAVPSFPTPFAPSPLLSPSKSPPNPILCTTTDTGPWLRIHMSDTQWSGPMATSSSRTLVWRMKGKQAPPRQTQSQSSGPRISLPPKFSSAKHTTGWSTTGHWYVQL